MDEKIFLLYENASGLMFSLMLLWIGNRQKLSWYRLGEALGKKEFFSWWWKELLLMMAMLFSVTTMAGFMEVLKEMEVSTPMIYTGFWLLTPLYVIYFSLMLAILVRRARALKGGKVIGAIAIILLMLPNVLLQILLWVLYLTLYIWPEKENEPVLA
jgi:hypothetical protein